MGFIDANCRFTVYSRSSTNGPVRSYISNFVLEVKLLLFQPWPPPTSARRPTRLGQCNYVELIDTIFTDVEGVD